MAGILGGRKMSCRGPSRQASKTLGIRASRFVRRRPRGARAELVCASTNGIAVLRYGMSASYCATLVCASKNTWPAHDDVGGAFADWWLRIVLNRMGRTTRRLRRLRQSRLLAEAGSSRYGRNLPLSPTTSSMSSLPAGTATSWRISGGECDAGHLHPAQPGSKRMAPLSPIYAPIWVLRSALPSSATRRTSRATCGCSTTLTVSSRNTSAIRRMKTHLAAPQPSGRRRPERSGTLRRYVVMLAVLAGRRPRAISSAAWR